MKVSKYLLSLVLIFFFGTLYSQVPWQRLNEQVHIDQKRLAFKELKPPSFQLFSVNDALLKSSLKQASKNQKRVTLPTPNGLQSFTVKEASVLAPALAEKYPNIKSYVGVGVDDPNARVRMSSSLLGIHAMITTVEHPLYLVVPYTKDKKVAIGYFKDPQGISNFECLVAAETLQSKTEHVHESAMVNDGKLRTFKMALIGTAEYAQFHLTNQGIGFTASEVDKKEAVLSAMNVSMTRINDVFERDLGVTMQLVANNDDLIFFDAATDGLTNDDIGALIDESQTICDAVIGSQNYDIGHVFGWINDESGTGLAGGGVVCNTGRKAEGVSMRKNPLGDLFDIDLVAHEIGHQFGANHTQNGSCNRNNATAVEPGSGSTIMGYAGFCDTNVQNNSDDYFHSVSIAEMSNYVAFNATCAVETVTTNTPPQANAGADFTIPIATPFLLKGAASDLDVSNILTYTWEQVNNQVASMPPLASSAVGPLFRSVPPSLSQDRYMPALSTVLAGELSSTWEVLPAVSRTMNFSFTVRDNATMGAATATDYATISVDGNAGPFACTSQTMATTVMGGSIQTVSWDVANTNASEVAATHVHILLSTDGGLTFPHVLLENTPNDGEEAVVVTNITTAQARIKIEPVNNIFYALNAVNFSIDKTASVPEDYFTNFQVYPNPSEGNITLTFGVKSQDADVVVQLFDMRGRLIDENRYEVVGETFKEQLRFPDIAVGLYHLKVKNGSRRISKKILIE